MDWNAFTIVGSMMPPRDPDEEDEEDEDEEEDIGDEPAVVREPDEDQSGAPVLVVSGWKPRSKLATLTCQSRVTTTGQSQPGSKRNMFTPA